MTINRLWRYTGLAAEGDPDAVDQPDHGHAGVAGSGHRTADRGAAGERAIRPRPATAVTYHVA